MYIAMSNSFSLPPSSRAARREKELEKQEKKERRRKRLEDVVAERMAKKRRSDSSNGEKPASSNGKASQENLESPVKTEPADPANSQVGVFISFNGESFCARSMSTWNPSTRTRRGMIRDLLGLSVGRNLKLSCGS